MVQTRKGVATDPSLVRGRDQDTGFADRQREDPLEDTALHVPPASHQPSVEESSRLQVGAGFIPAGDLPPERVESQEQKAAPAIALIPVMNPVLIAQTVRAVIESMPNTVAPTPLVAPAVLVPLTTPVVPTAIDSDSVITIVRTAKSMRELGCEPFLGKQDTKIAGRWMRKIENTMTQMKEPEDWRVNCATRLLLDRAQSWWEVIQSRRDTGTLTWSEFKRYFLFLSV
jgi:hypothetical protein